jgi:hypothetical protein
LTDNDKHPIIAALEQWEEVLNKLPANKADQEFGLIRHHLEQIGNRIGRRLAASTQNRCAACHGPLPARGPVDTIPRHRPGMNPEWQNDFACSTRCADKLKEAQHKRELERLAAQ